MAFEDIDELIDPTLTIPGIRGRHSCCMQPDNRPGTDGMRRCGHGEDDWVKRTYVVQPVDAEVGLWAQRLIAAGFMVVNGEELPADAPKLQFGDAEEIDLYERVLGSVYHRLRADGVPWEIVCNIGQTALVCAGANRQLAEQYWNSGCNPNSMRPAANRAQRRATRTRNTAGASTTRSPGSTSGTTSRRAGSRAKGKGSPAAS